jgi:PEP-CTERM motif
MVYKLTTTIGRLAMTIAIVFLGSPRDSLATYIFLPVTGNGIGGNAATSQFTSANGYGVINVTHSFSPSGAGPDDNNNAAIFPSMFSTVFPGTGNVQGHLAQTKYSSSSVVTFDLTGYTMLSTTVFGMWNTTDEATQPPYRIELIDAASNPVPPTTFTTFGTQDNTGAGQPNGRHQMVLNSATGDISAGAVINGGVGIHTNALFWNMIPTGTKEIRVYGNLSPLAGNIAGDGVGYYFAELMVPEPATCVLMAIGLMGVLAFRQSSRTAQV